MIKGDCPGAIFVGFYFIVTGEGLGMGFDSISIVAASASAYILGKNIVFLFLCWLRTTQPVHYQPYCYLALK